MKLLSKFRSHNLLTFPINLFAIRVEAIKRRKKSIGTFTISMTITEKELHHKIDNEIIQTCRSSNLIKGFHFNNIDTEISSMYHRLMMIIDLRKRNFAQEKSRK